MLEREALEAAGWKFGDAADFLQMSDDERQLLEGRVELAREVPVAEVLVVDYDPAWPAIFEVLRAHVWPGVGDFAVSIEHVGSTSVVGLAAKPVIDMTVVVGAAADVPRAIERLAALGYCHRGDLGVRGREAFACPEETPAHHLYACVQGNLPLRNHLALRDCLRRDPEAAQAYGRLKKRLAAEFPRDIGSYIEGKTSFILDILAAAGFNRAELAEISAINKP